MSGWTGQVFAFQQKLSFDDPPSSLLRPLFELARGGVPWVPCVVADSMSEGLAYVTSARQHRGTERGRLRRWKRRCGGTARMTV